MNSDTNDITISSSSTSNSTSKNKYDDIDFCLKTLYNFYYNSGFECYIFKRINASDVSIADIKKDKDFDYNKILQGVKIKHIGTNRDRYLFKRYSNTYPALLKISFYGANKPTVNLDVSNIDPVAVDMLIHYLFSELIISEKLKFIMLPIMNFDITYQDLKKANLDVVKKIPQKSNIVGDGQSMYVQVLEHYHDISPLRYLIEQTDVVPQLVLKVIIFQVLYALYKISIVYPTFRHNSLDVDSVYVYYNKKDLKEGGVTRFRVIDTYYEIPNVGYEIKLTNFEQANITNVVDNRGTNLIEDNQYYDVHYFIQSLLKTLKPDNFIKGGTLERFFDTVLPEIFRSSKENTGLDEVYYKKEMTNISTPIFSPALILTKINFFAEFIKMPKNSKKSQKSKGSKGSTKTKTKTNSKKKSKAYDASISFSDSIDSYGIKDNDIEYSVSSFSVDDSPDISVTHGSDSPILLARQQGKSKSKSKKSNKQNSKDKKYKSKSIPDPDDPDDPDDIDDLDDIMNMGTHANMDESDSFDMNMNTMSEHTSNKSSGSSFRALFGEPLNQDMNQNHKSKPRGRTSSNQNSVQQQILSKLPADFEGSIPDNMQEMLNAAQNSNTRSTGANMRGVPGMNAVPQDTEGFINYLDNPGSGYGAIDAMGPINTLPNAPYGMSEQSIGGDLGFMLDGSTQGPPPNLPAYPNYASLPPQPNQGQATLPAHLMMNNQQMDPTMSFGQNSHQTMSDFNTGLTDTAASASMGMRGMIGGGSNANTDTEFFFLTEGEVRK